MKYFGILEIFAPEDFAFCMETNQSGDQIAGNFWKNSITLTLYPSQSRSCDINTIQ
jgi:hypothetical protein